MGWTAFTSRMGRRIAWVVAVCATVPVVLFAFAVAREVSSAGTQADERRLTGVSSLYADVIRSRIGVAETYDVIVAPGHEPAYTIFAQAQDRSGYARATLASREGLSAVVPPMDPRVSLDLSPSWKFLRTDAAGAQAKCAGGS